MKNPQKSSWCALFDFSWITKKLSKNLVLPEVEVIIHILEKLDLKTSSGLWDITRTKLSTTNFEDTFHDKWIFAHITPNNIKLDPSESTLHELSKDEKKNKKEFGKASYQAHKVGTSRLEKFGAQCQAQTNPAPSTVPKFSPSL